LSVVFYHARLPFFSGGYVGVDVFFVISGYLISGLLMREVEQKGRIDLLKFYARRIRRLLPAALVVLVATVIAARIWLSPLEQLELVPSVLFSALYASNLLFAFKATDYLAGGVHSNLLLHTWSLSVEEQFYLMWPAVIMLGAYLAMKTRGRSSAPFRAGALVSMASVCVLSLSLALWTMRVSQPWAFFGSPMRAWEFAAGGLAFMVTPYVARRCSDRVKDALVALGFAVTMGAVLFFDDRTPFPG
jgi:peptidoglycan/LPS O-acetylase OafA/YrhL